MSEKTVTTYWAGFVDGKLHLSDTCDGNCKEPTINTRKSHVELMFKDVRMVKITEVKKCSKRKH